jgi:putative hydrolase of the HAD superfamily
LFDLDNTLIDRDRAMKEAVRHWLEGQETVGEAKMYTALEHILEKDNSGYADRDRFCAWLCDEYANVRTKTIKTPREVLRDLQELAISYLQPDAEVLETLHQLKQQYQLAIASNGSRYIQQKKIAQAGLGDVFLSDRIYISETLGQQKPDPGFYRQILETLGKRPEQCIMVGDHEVNDIEGARHCGLHTCWINHKGSSGKPEGLMFNHMTEARQWLRGSI